MASKLEQFSPIRPNSFDLRLANALSIRAQAKMLKHEMGVKNKEEAAECLKAVKAMDNILLRNGFTKKTIDAISVMMEEDQKKKRRAVRYE